jgi:uncharacterized protein YerC
MKVRSRSLSSRQKMEILDTLYTTAASVKGRGAMKLFLRDLLTESERIMMGRRILIARKLIAGETFRTINAELHVGKDTVWRVERWLHDTLPGYEQALEGLEQALRERDEKYLYATSALYRLKKKYPLHFLLFPTPKVKRR